MSKFLVLCLYLLEYKIGLNISRWFVLNFTLSNLSEKINSDFESLLLQSEWKNYTALFLQRYNQREVDYALHATETQAKMQQLQAKAKLVHDELDEKLNDAKCKIADLEVQVSHDVQRLSKKFEGQHSESGKVCLEDRVKLSQCYNTLKDGGECEIFAKKLEKCVTDALAKA